MSDPATLTLFCLHFLGGSAREWQWLAAALQDAVRLEVLDLPGFGDDAATGGRDVAEMAETVAAAVRAAAPTRWGLAGHSMGAKVALAVARRAEDGEPGLGGLDRLVLLSGSPPSPEPMTDAKREEMLRWFAGLPERSAAEAADYIAGNVGASLHGEMHAQAVADVLRADPGAWRNWLERGSREDWVARIGVLRTPALIVAGSADAGLGPDAQREHMAPHLARHRLVTLDGAGHLLPMERPDELAGLIAAHAAEFWPAHGMPMAGEPVPAGASAAFAARAAGTAPVLDPAFAALVRSPRLATALRDVLEERARPDDPAYVPSAMDMAALATLRAVTARVLPQPATAFIDLAARIDTALAAGTGDGWRFASLPPDREATRAGLRTLDAAAAEGAFAALDGVAQDRMLERCAAGELGVAGAPLDAAQMRDWFEDLRAAAVQIYVAHPATLSRMGYGGLFAGGDDVRTAPGFAVIGEGEVEAWEPHAHPQPAAPAKGPVPQDGSAS